MTQPRQRRSGCLPVLLLTALLVMVLAIAYIRVTSRVDNNFGKPDPRLGTIQRIKQTLTLYRGDFQLSRPNLLLEETKLVIEFAEPVNSVCSRLEAGGAVSSGQLLCSYLIYKGLDRDLQAGQFAILPQISSIQIAQRITDPRLKDLIFTIYPGWRLEEAASAISLAGYAESYDNILFSLKWPDKELSTGLGLDAGLSLEGYLCSETYAVKPETPLDELAKEMTACHSSYLSDKSLLDNFTANGLNYHQALTLASIIQRETLQSNEMPTIASVFYNRLAQGMMLQTDPTVQYALGYESTNNTWWKSELTISDLELESPYNTYRVIGLPPGPISTPSREALLAVANPAATEFLYFRAKCDGSFSHAFAVTYDEHLLNACP